MAEQVVVITGGSRGLGKGLAQQFVARKDYVLICAPDKNEIDCVGSEIGAASYGADVTNEGQMQALAEYAVGRFGSIDIWINNAGIWHPHAPVQELDVERVRQMVNVNTIGTIIGSKHALIQMKKQGEGTIINIISMSGLMGHPLSSGYAASKWGARGFTESLREECRGSKIRIVSVYPDRMKTDLFDEDLPKDLDQYLSYEEVAEKIVRNLDLKKIKSEIVIRKGA